MKPDEIDSTEEIYRGRVVHLWIDRFCLPDGRERTRERVEHVGAVCLVPLDAEGHLLFVRQYRAAVRRELLELPAGTLEPNEAPEACAARELEEETGYRAGTLKKLFGAYVAPGYSSEYIHTFLATDLTLGQVNPDEDEDLELVRIPLQEAVRMSLNGEIEDSKTISSILVANHHLNAQTTT